MDELTEPEDWSFEPLKDLDRLLRCSICFEYFKTAMMMPNCSHTYCSLCIRRHLQNRKLCPMCSKPVIESQLQSNRLIDSLVCSFKSNRNAFMSLLAGTTKNGLTTPSNVAMATTSAVVGGASPLSYSPLCVPQPPSASGTSILDLTDSELSQGLTSDVAMMDTHNTSHVPAVKGSSIHASDEVRRSVKERPSSLSGTRALSSPAISAVGGSTPITRTVVSAVVHPQTPSGHSHTSKTPSRRLSEGLNKKSQKEGSSESSRGREKSTDVSSSSGSGSVSQVESQASVARDNVATPTSSNNLKVPCPVCQVEVFEKFINTHLDKCLNQITIPSSSSGSHTSSSSPHLKRLPKLVFNIMNDKQLRKQLKEYHLSTQGKRDVLLKRLKEFTLLYNAECDSLNPRTMEEIAQEVERAERSKLAGGSVSSRKVSTPSSSAASSSTSLPPPPQSSRKSSASEIAEMREQYVKAHNEHFSKLIADVRARDIKCRSSSNTSDTVTTPTNLGNVSIQQAREQSDSSVSPPVEMKRVDTPPHSSIRTPHITTTAATSSRNEMIGVRDQDDRVLLDQELEEDSQIVFASDSPSPPFLGGRRRGEGGRGAAAAVGAGGSSSSRLLFEETTSIPESPTAELKVTPSSRKRASTRNKRSSAISLSTLYQDEEEDAVIVEDPDFLPSNTTPFKARKKQKRY